MSNDSGRALLVGPAGWHDMPSSIVTRQSDRSTQPWTLKVALVTLTAKSGLGHLGCCNGHVLGCTH